MSPRTSSSHGLYDEVSEFDHQNPYFSNISQANLFPSQQQNNITPSGSNVSRNDIAGASSARNNSNNNESGLFTLPLNIPRRVLSSSVVKNASLMVLYSFCITTVFFIFFASYVLTLYDDTRRAFRNSRVWAQLRSGVKERIAMMGEDWEEFLQKHFDQSWDNGLSGDVNNNNSSTSNDANSKRNSHPNPNNNGGVPGIPNPTDLEWFKGAVLGFMAVVAGQDVANKVQESFRGQSSTPTAGGDSERK